MGRLMDSIMAAVGLKPSDRVDLSVVPASIKDDTKNQHNTAQSGKSGSIYQKNQLNYSPNENDQSSESSINMKAVEETGDPLILGYSFLPADWKHKKEEILNPDEQEEFIKRAEELLKQFPDSRQETKRHTQKKNIRNVEQVSPDSSEQLVKEEAPITAENWHQDLPPITQAEAVEQEGIEDCLQCKVIGTATFSAAGAYVVHTAWKNKDGYVGRRLQAFRLSGALLAGSTYLNTVNRFNLAT